MGQPTEGALIAAAMKHGMYNVADRYVRLQEYPFSSEQKMMAVKCVSKYDDKQEIFFVKGAIEKILPKCTKYCWNGNEQSLNQKKRMNLLLKHTKLVGKVYVLFLWQKVLHYKILFIWALWVFVIHQDHWYGKRLLH